MITPYGFVFWRHVVPSDNRVEERLEMKELLCGPRGNIEKLFTEHPEETRHNFLEPTHILDVEAVFRGKLREVSFVKWADRGMGPDVTVSALFLKGAEPEDSVSVNYTFQAQTGRWVKDVFVDGEFSIDSAYTSMEQTRKPLDGYDFADLNVLIATAKVVRAAQPAVA